MSTPSEDPPPEHTDPERGQPVPPQSAFRQSRLDLLQWVLRELKIDFQLSGESVTIALAEADHAKFDGQSKIVVAANPSAAPDETFEVGSRFADWINEQLAARGGILHARPTTQPLAVNDLMKPLFAAYQVDGGQVHLGGCELTDHPFLRLSYALDDHTAGHVFVAPDGSSLEDALVKKLGLDNLGPAGERPPRMEANAVSALTSAGKRIASKQTATRDPNATAGEPLATTVAWIRHAEGQLQFTIGESSTTLPFSSWAKLLEPEPYVGRFSGASTFHLAVDDEGRIDAAEQIDQCEHSGRRVLKQELVECRVTGKQVLQEFTEVCPVTGHPTLRGEFAVCEMCQQRVSLAALADQSSQEGDLDRAGRCGACHSLAKVGKEDARLVWILGEHPGLERWSRWHLAETESVYVAQASRLTKRLLVVIDKEDLSVRHLASGGRLGGPWTEVVGEARTELLK